MPIFFWSLSKQMALTIAGVPILSIVYKKLINTGMCKLSDCVVSTHVVFAHLLFFLKHTENAVRILFGLRVSSLHQLHKVEANRWPFLCHACLTALGLFMCTYYLAGSFVCVWLPNKLSNLDNAFLLSWLGMASGCSMSTGLCSYKAKR